MTNTDMYTTKYGRIYNVPLAIAIGHVAATLWGVLEDDYEFWEDRGKLDDGWFYVTAEKFEKKTGYSYKRQLAALKKLEDLGLIKTQLRGLPSVKYFKLDRSKLYNLDCPRVNELFGKDLQNVNPTYDEMTYDKREDNISQNVTQLYPKREDSYMPKGKTIGSYSGFESGPESGANRASSSYEDGPSSNEEEPFPPTGTTGVELNMKSSSNSCMGGPNGCSNEAAEAAAEAKPKKAKPVRHKHGEYQHVMLSDEEYSKLKDQLSNQADVLIDRMDAWIEAKGKSPYTNYYVALLNWSKKDYNNKSYTKPRSEFEQWHHENEVSRPITKDEMKPVSIDDVTPEEIAALMVD